MKFFSANMTGHTNMTFMKYHSYTPLSSTEYLKQFQVRFASHSVADVRGLFI